MDRQTRFVRRFALAAALLAAVVAVVPAPAAASHRERQRELQRLIQEKRQALARAEAQERDIIAEIRESDRRRAALQHQIAVLDARLRSARAEINLLETRLDRLAVALRQNNVELEQALAALDEQVDRLNRRVAEMYMFGAVSQELDPVPGVTQDLNDVIDANAYGESLVQSDGLLVEQIERTRVRIEQQRATIEAAQVQVEADRGALAEQARKIALARADLIGARNAVRAEIALKARLLEQVRDQKETYQRALRSYLEESRSIAAFLQGVQAGQTVIQGRGGWLRWPVSGRITSPFGWRRHPIYGYRSFHTGIDISSPSGTLVKAARYGEVVYTGYKGAYGLVVIIDHGYGIATMYAHLSRVYVHDGQRVSTLAGIAAVGTTGWSTGPHLHFEVRRGGEPVNPLRWL